MIRSIAFALLAFLVPQLALGQGGGVNPPPGSVWTYLGPTYGAGWILGSMTPPMSLVGNITGPIVNNGWVLTASTNPTYNAQQIFAWAVGTGSVAPLYDSLQGVSWATPGSTVSLTNAVGGYVVSNISRTVPYPSFPVATALNGVAIADADGAGVWGVNTIVSDNRGQVVSSHGPRFLSNEFDCNVTSPNTTCSILAFGGNSLVQPAGLNGPTCNSGGPGILWTYCFGTGDAVTNTFAYIGAKTKTAGAYSQDIDFWWYDATVTRQVTSLAATPNGMLIASTVAAAASLTMTGNLVLTSGVVKLPSNSGIQINSQAVVSADGSGGSYLCGASASVSCAVGQGGSSTLSLEGPVIKAVSLPNTPAGLRQVCINPSTWQLYVGAAGTGNQC